jgi:acetoin utilization deacetylase AcuC-like enzyme
MWSTHTAQHEWFLNAPFPRQRFGLRRVLIVDWDVHHGDGTQRVLEKHGNDSILFTSIHRYGSGFFPGTGVCSARVGSRARSWVTNRFLPLEEY